jgi:NADPH:quinone reductase-like Zn-dependent oxidoreductase
MLGHITDPNVPGGLDRRDLPDPEPGPHDALVAVRAYAVNRGELSLLEQRADGWLPGQDVAGEVVAQAADGSGPAAGTRVVGPADGGGWSQRVAIPSHRLAALPDAVSFEDAAALPVAGLTAYRALQTGGPLLGRRVLVTGATGGVGRMAVQLARESGADVTALVRDAAASAGRLRRLGARAVVQDVDGDFDLVVDCAGGAAFTLAIEHVAPRGVVVNLATEGETVTFRAARFDRSPGARIYTLNLRDELAGRGAGPDLARLCALTAAGRLDGQVELEASWRDAGEAMRALLERRIGGKAVLRIEASP